MSPTADGVQTLITIINIVYILKIWNHFPMKGKCLTKSLVYRAEIISHQDSAEYIGLTSNSFKQRYLNHISSFKNIKYKESTALAKYIWKLKDEKKEFNINWSVAAKAPPYNPVAKSCHLCITEKAFIVRSKYCIIQYTAPRL